MAGSPTGRLVLIDAHSLIFQVFHAIQDMSSPSGLPVNALFGFARDILYLRGRKPDYLICVFDIGDPTNRMKIDPSYKANRGAMPEDLCVQIPYIKDMVEAMGVPVLGEPDVEADDVIATLARAGSARGLHVQICTSDKDCRQLLDDNIRLFNLRKKTEFGPAELLADWGIRPDQVVDFQALVGDSVDNVKGVPGIGEKTATTLLQQFDSLDNVLAQVDQVSGAKRQENLRAWAAGPRTSRRLLRLDDQVPLVFDWEAWKLRPVDESRLATMFKEFGFRTLLAQVTSAPPGAHTLPAPAPAPPRPKQGELFSEEDGVSASGTISPAPSHPDTMRSWRAAYHLVDTPRAFEELLRELGKQNRFAFDLETTSLHPHDADIVGIALSWREGEAWYLALRGPKGAKTLPANTLEALRPILEDVRIAKVNQNIKYDLMVLKRHGLIPRGVAGDSMVAHYLLHAGERGHNLEALAQEYLHHQVIPITDLIGKKPRTNEKGARQKRMDEVETARVAEYAGEDADVALRLAGLLEGQLVGSGLKDLYDRLEVPLIEVLASMEYQGIRLDTRLLKRIGKEMEAQLAGMELEIHALAGHPFNIASLKQLRTVLFEELKLPVRRKTGITGEASTDQETLEELAAQGHALPAKILNYRQLAKLKSTYVDALPEAVHPRTGRIHASFNQTIAATGRLSSSEPNLQNIPVRREMGQQVRQAFLPEEGWILLTADYSQIELRLLAHFCGDRELRRAFAEDRDVHALVAAQVFGVTEPEVTSEMRRMAKIVNFGVIYGMSAVGLAQRLSMKRDDASRFIDAYFGRYPKVLEYQSQLLAQCRSTGQVSTILGRRRTFDRNNIRRESTYQQRNQTEREAINMEIQGSAADLIKLAMLNVYQRLQREKCRARLLLQIHDELVFEVPPEEKEAVVVLVHEEMASRRESELNLQVPLKVDMALGPNWLDVVEMAQGAA